MIFAIGTVHLLLLFPILILLVIRKEHGCLDRHQSRVLSRRRRHSTSVSVDRIKMARVAAFS